MWFCIVSAQYGGGKMSASVALNYSVTQLHARAPIEAHCKIVAPDIIDDPRNVYGVNCLQMKMHLYAQVTKITSVAHNFTLHLASTKLSLTIEAARGATTVGARGDSVGEAAPFSGSFATSPATLFTILRTAHRSIREVSAVIVATVSPTRSIF